MQIRSAPAASDRTAPSPWPTVSAIAFMSRASVIDHAVEAELVAQQPEQDRAQGGRPVVVRREHDVRGHDATRPGVDHGGERREVAIAQHLDRVVDGRQGEVGVDVGRAVPGEVLGAGRDAGGLQPADEGGAVPGDEVGRRAEGPHADDRVAPGRRSRRPRGPGPRRRRRRAAVGPSRRPLRVVASTSSRAPRAAWPGYGEPGAHVEPGDVAALLVGHHQHRAALPCRSRGERSVAWSSSLDVLREPADAAEAVVDPARRASRARVVPTKPVTHRRRGRGGSMLGHPLTAPAASPDDSRRLHGHEEQHHGHRDDRRAGHHRSPSRSSTG